MKAEPEPSLVKHDPLPDSTSHIRLLEILEGTFGQPVACHLTTWPIDTAPPYYAISYTWGDPASVTRIVVNGGQMAVRRNCEYALQQAFATKASKYFWLDAICIDQQNIQEKNHQVALMGQLYTRAEHVLACVGPHVGDSKFLFNTIHNRRSLFAAIHSKIGKEQSAWNAEWVFSLIQPKKRLGLRCYFAMDAALRQRLRDAFLDFLRRTYFKRVWILQELYLASGVSFCCGVDICAHDSLESLCQLLMFWTNGQIYPHTFFRTCKFTEHINRNYMDPSSFRLHNLASLLPDGIFKRKRICKPWPPLIGEGITTQLRCMQLASGAQPLRTIPEIMPSMGGFFCEDLRDRLYGIMRLVDWEGRSAPVPDYAKDNFEIATEVLSRIISSRMSDRVAGLACARRIGKLFKISPTQEAMQRAIEIRKSPSRALNEPTKSEYRACNSHENWVGIQLRSERFGDEIHLTFTGVNDSFPSPRYRRYALRELDLLGTPLNCVQYAWVPEKAREGDWLVVCMSYPDKVNLVLRAAENNQFSIIGLAGNFSWLHRHAEEGPQKFFEMWWHPEDVLILQWFLYYRSTRKAVNKPTAEQLNWRVCSFENSSYATIFDKEAQIEPVP